MTDLQMNHIFKSKHLGRILCGMFRVLIFTRVTISDVYALVEQILLALQRSTIAPREAQDKMSHFWNVYKVESEEYDEELYAVYSSRMDNSTIFVCLPRASYT